MRIKFDTQTDNTEVVKDELDSLIQQYAMNKTEFDSYKKICDKENAEIKAIMLDGKIDSRISGDYKATFDALEKAIYDGKLTQDQLLELDRAKEVKEVVTLRVTKIKKKKED